MTHEEAVDAILTEFDTAWADRTPVAHANVDFEPDENSSWARVTVIHSSAAQVSLGSVGSRTFRRFGTVIVQVFVPEGTSTQPALELGDAAVSALEGKFLTGGLQLQAAALEEVGPDGRGWYQLNISAPFHFNLTGA